MFGGDRCEFVPLGLRSRVGRYAGKLMVGCRHHPTIPLPASQREAFTDVATLLGSDARPASKRATGTRKGEQDT